MRTNLTDTFKTRAKPGLYWDTHRDAPKGFGLKVNPGGSRNFILNYRLKDSGRERRLVVCDASVPIADARKRAAELRLVVDAGGDPLAAWQEKRTAPTVEELTVRFKAEALPRRAPRTQAEYTAMLDTYILPAIGSRKVADVARADIEKLHARITGEGKKRRANAVLAVARLLFEQAIVWGLRDEGTNPAKRIARNPEPPRERYLSDAEGERLNAALDQWQAAKPDSVDIIRVLWLTGSRRGETTRMAWGQLDLDAGVWTKPAPVVKQRKLHRVPLSVEVVELLRRRLDARETGPVVALRKDDRVFPGTGVADKLERDWRVIRASAGLDDVHLHDLRHSYASVLVAQGLSLPIIGALLGHSQPATTARYAHLADWPLREATALVGKIVGGGKE
jgi:integrase